MIEVQKSRIISTTDELSRSIRYELDGQRYLYVDEHYESRLVVQSAYTAMLVLHARYLVACKIHNSDSTIIRAES